MKPLTVPFLLVVALLGAACSAQQSRQAGVSATAGASHSGRPSTQGALKVYSAQGWDVVDDLPGYVHSDYKILTPERRLLMMVANAGPMNDPVTVRLPVGSYLVMAQAAKRGSVEVPVTIEPGLLTEVRPDEQPPAPR